MFISSYSSSRSSASVVVGRRGVHIKAPPKKSHLRRRREVHPAPAPVPASLACRRDRPSQTPTATMRRETVVVVFLRRLWYRPIIIIIIIIIVVIAKTFFIKKIASRPKKARPRPRPRATKTGGRRRYRRYRRYRRRRRNHHATLLRVLSSSSSSYIRENWGKKKQPKERRYFHVCLRYYRTLNKSRLFFGSGKTFWKTIKRRRHRRERAR